MKEILRSQINAECPWRDTLHWFDTIDSTNTQAKIMAAAGAPHGTVLIAGHQTGGRGRMGRQFHSPKDAGVYLSVILRPQCAPAALMHLTCAAGIAACDAVEAAAGFRPGIKWTNDLVYERKKLGGILTELSLATDGNVSWAIVGIGINCDQQNGDFPPNLRNMATSLFAVSGISGLKQAVAAALVEQLYRMSLTLIPQKHALLARYRSDCVTLGQEISVLRGEEVRHGKALDIDNSGGLIVLYPDGSRESITSGEVSIRGMYGYV